MNDCRRLFAKSRGVNKVEARQIVAEEGMGSRSLLGRLLKSWRHRFEDVKGQQFYAAATL
jgi:hypothetical protein